MKSTLLVLMLFGCDLAQAQDHSIVKEDFVNAVYRLVVDSSFSPYYLSGEAAACSFKKFDYDEWYKYALLEDVPIYTLNELARNSFLDKAPYQWHQGKLKDAVCVNQQAASGILASAKQVKHGRTQVTIPNVVFCFSRPVFTDDGHYAVIDMSFRCDDRQCGMGATFLFRQENGDWKLAGKKLAWGN